MVAESVSAPVPASETTLGARTLSKVPEITALFWIIKVFTTAMGESTSDFLLGHLNPALGASIGLVGFVVALVIQFRTTRYRPAAYWFAVVMVSVFGTMVADGLHVVLHVPYIVTAPSFAVILAIVFVLWRRTEGTLSIHSITTRRREIFYWCAILSTFALGTATGDLTASTFHLGYLPSALTFTVVIAIPAVWYAIGRRHAILTFWFAYVVTRPLGASYADWMASSRHHGALGWGTGPVSLTLFIIIVILVGFLVRGSTSRRPLTVSA